MHRNRCVSVIGYGLEKVLCLPHAGTSPVELLLLVFYHILRILSMEKRAETREKNPKKMRKSAEKIFKIFEKFASFGE
jgi:hypothetical protein